jgi:hypothetical protein
MSKKFNAKERDKLAQELIAADLDFDLDILGPSKNPRKSIQSFGPLVKLIWRWYKVFYRKKLTERL